MESTVLRQEKLFGRLGFQVVFQVCFFVTLQRFKVFLIGLAFVSELVLSANRNRHFSLTGS